MSTMWMLEVWTIASMASVVAGYRLLSLPNLRAAHVSIEKAFLLIVVGLCQAKVYEAIALWIIFGGGR